MIPPIPPTCPFIVNRRAPEDYPTQTLLILGERDGGYEFLEFPMLWVSAEQECLIYGSDLDWDSARPVDPDKLTAAQGLRSLMMMRLWSWCERFPGVDFWNWTDVQVRG